MVAPGEVAATADGATDAGAGSGRGEGEENAAIPIAPATATITAIATSPADGPRGEPATAETEGASGARFGVTGRRRRPPYPRYGSSWRSANSTLAGRSASRRMYHGYHAAP